MTLSPLTLTVCSVVIAVAIVLLALSLFGNYKLAVLRVRYLNERDYYYELLEKTGDVITNALREQVEGLDEELWACRPAFAGRPDIQAAALKRMAEDMRTLSTIAGYAESTPRRNLFSLLARIRVRLTIDRVVLSDSPALSEEMRGHTDAILKHLKVFAIFHGYYLRLKHARRADGSLLWRQEQWAEKPIIETTTAELQLEARQLLGLIEMVDPGALNGDWRP